MWNAAGELHDFDSAGDFASRIGQNLAVFAGNDRGELVGMGIQQFLELEHDARATQRRGGRPCRKRFLCRFDGGGDFTFGSERHAGFYTAQRRIVDVAVAPALAGDFGTTDEVVDFLQDGRLVQWFVHVFFSSECSILCVMQQRLCGRW